MISSDVCAETYALNGVNVLETVGFCSNAPAGPNSTMYRVMLADSQVKPMYSFYRS